MENSFFIFTDKEKPIEIERFHTCTWEFENNSSLVEFGFEISKDSLNEDELSISIFIPWLSTSCQVSDLYEKLSIPENSRFIFNDSLTNTASLDGGRNKLGVIHTFADRNELCILPVNISKIADKIINVTTNLKPYYNTGTQSNIYFRFCIKPSFSYISVRKRGISKSTIIYDIKVNERRNIPDDLVALFNEKDLSKITSCFSFNILPNKYDIVFFDNASLKNVRTLEYDSFNRYLGDKRVKKDELIVVFNKKQGGESYSFFSVYSKERIGPGQFALAILINIVCGILLFIPAYRKSFQPELSFSNVWANLPLEIFLALGIAILTLIFFIWPSIINICNKSLSPKGKRR